MWKVPQRLRKLIASLVLVQCSTNVHELPPAIWGKKAYDFLGLRSWIPKLWLHCISCLLLPLLLIVGLPVGIDEFTKYTQLDCPFNDMIITNETTNTMTVSNCSDICLQHVDCVAFILYANRCFIKDVCDLNNLNDDPGIDIYVRSPGQFSESRLRPTPV